MRRGEHAVVLGGSVAGLVAAKAASGHFDRVTIVERDELPTGAALRKGVPQARHVHALLARGSQVLETLFPGFDAELASLGVPLIQLGQESGWLSPTGWTPAFSPPIPGRFCTRPLLESVIRGRVRGLSNVTFLEGTDIEGLTFSADSAAVTGARVSTAGQPRELSADFVIDASGRGSRTPKWIEAVGYAPPQETVVDSKVTYVTRRYANLAPHLPSPWKVLVVLWDPPFTRAGVIFPIENGEHLVTLVGAMGETPPTELEGFLEYAKTLRSPWVYEAARRATPVGEPTASRSTENKIRLYHRLERFPRRLAVVGDAFCAFNPIHGQGMTVASVEATILDRLFADATVPLDDLGKRFLREAGDLVRPVWTIATSEDVRMTNTSGRPDPASVVTKAYFTELGRVIKTHPDVMRTMVEVLQMLRPTHELLKPSIVGKVLWSALNRMGEPAEKVSVDPGEVGWAIPERPPELAPTRHQT